MSDKRFIVFNITKEQITNYPENELVKIGYKQQLKIKIERNSMIYNELKVNLSKINIYQVMLNNFIRTPFQIVSREYGYDLYIVLPVYYDVFTIDEINIVIDRDYKYNNEVCGRVEDITELQDLYLDFSKEESLNYLKCSKPNNIVFFGGDT